jgi:hypothetical protein
MERQRRRCESHALADRAGGQPFRAFAYQQPVHLEAVLVGECAKGADGFTAFHRSYDITSILVMSRRGSGSFAGTDSKSGRALTAASGCIPDPVGSYFGAKVPRDKESPMLRATALAAVILATAGPSTVAGAQDLDEERPIGEVALSDDTMQLRYIASGSKMDLERASRISAGFFLSESRDIVLMGDVLFPAQLNIDRLQFLFGPRAYAALLEDENNDVLAASLGVEVRYELDRSSGLAISGQAFYSPDILTFGSANNLTDLSARAEIRVQPRMTIFGGMRWFEFELTEGEEDRTLQEELFAGVAWRF